MNIDHPDKLAVVKHALELYVQRYEAAIDCPANADAFRRRDIAKGLLRDMVMEDQDPPSYWDVKVITKTSDSDGSNVEYEIEFIGGRDGRVNGIIKPGQRKWVPANQFLKDPDCMDPEVGKQGLVAISQYWAEQESWL
jgi:hypothetical protein